MSDTSTSTHTDVTARKRIPGPGIMPGRKCWDCPVSTPYGRVRGPLRLWMCMGCAEAYDARKTA